MNALGKVVAAATLATLTSLFSGCVSSSLVDIWHDPSFQAPPLAKLLVIAVRKDATKRRIWEDAFAGELMKNGAMATPSYSLFPDAPPDTNQVVATAQANGFDAILVVLRLPKETSKQYVQGYSTTEQYARYSTYWQRYVTYYQEINHPGYVDSQTVGIHAIDVTSTGSNGRLIWSGTSRTPEPGSMPDVQRGIAGLVISDLAKRNIINSKK
jgi:hypothetical protein